MRRSGLPPGLGAKYTSTEPGSGELTLTMESTGEFTLVLAIWDSVVLECVGQQVLQGRWTFRENRLRLDAPTRRLVYRLVPDDTAGRGSSSVLRWERSDLPTFADGFALAEAR